MKINWRKELANLFLFTFIFSEIRFGLQYTMTNSLHLIFRDKVWALLPRYFGFPIILYVVYLLIRGGSTES